MGAVLTIEIAVKKGSKHLWLWIDSMLVLLTFKSSKVVTCVLRNKWDNYLFLTFSIYFFVSHIYRKNNHGAEKMAKLGLSLPLSSSFTRWNYVPPHTWVDYARNRHDFHFY
jgi:hypothetical protein